MSGVGCVCVGGGGCIRSSVVTPWTSGQQVERSILHQWHDSYQNLSHSSWFVPSPVQCRISWPKIPFISFPYFSMSKSRAVFTPLTDLPATPSSGTLTPPDADSPVQGPSRRLLPEEPSRMRNLKHTTKDVHADAPATQSSKGHKPLQGPKLSSVSSTTLSRVQLYGSDAPREK